MENLPKIPSHNALPRKCPIPKDKKRFKYSTLQLVRKILYIVKTVDITLILLLNTIFAEQSKMTEVMMDKVEQVLDYFTTLTNVKTISRW